MLIEFGGSASELELADRDKLEFVVAELLVSHKKGHHYAVFQRDAAKWILENLNLSERERGTLRRLIADFTQSASLLDTVELRILIEPSHRSGIQRAAGTLTVGLDDLQSNYFFDRAALVVEDQETDGEFFLEIAEACRKMLKAPNVALDVRHGGGERSKDVLMRLAGERRIALLVTDSDKSHPQKGLPAKVLRYTREVSETGWGLAWVTCTPCRESENLIPLSVFERLPCRFGRENDLVALAHIADEEIRSGCPPEESFWWFYDLKKGVDREKLDRVSHDAIRTWTTGKLELANAEFAGFGESILSQLLANSSPLSVFLSQTKTAPWWELFGDMIKLIIQFGFAPTIQRT